MIRMEGALAKAGIEADMLLQVHDELIFEVPQGTENDAMPVIKRVMEGAAEPAVRLNVPIQGSAADIIRRAMIRMEPELKKAGIEADMLLQVHDELIFEVPAGTENDAMPVIKRVMEGAAEPAVRLSVPIQVDAHAAHNWDEAH